MEEPHPHDAQYPTDSPPEKLHFIAQKDGLIFQAIYDGGCGVDTIILYYVHIYEVGEKMVEW